MPYSCSICCLNSWISSNSPSFTKCTNLTLYSKFSASPSWACSFSPFCSFASCSSFETTALNKCNATVQSFPPLKLNAICCGLIEKSELLFWPKILTQTCQKLLSECSKRLRDAAKTLGTQLEWFLTNVEWLLPFSEDDLLFVGLTLVCERLSIKL